MSKSLAEQLASLPEADREAILAELPKEQLENLAYDANFWLRPEQIIPDGDWYITALIAGRGFGKTLAMSQWIRKKAMENPGCRIAIAARTTADLRNTVVTGESGILAVHPDSERPEYKPSTTSLHWPNGSSALLLSSEAPDSARGPQFHFAVGDEFAAWKTDVDSSGATLYSNIIAATRLGENPQILLATTPKRTKVMQDLMKQSKDPEEKIQIIRGSTFDNTSLSTKYIDNLVRRYGNSDLAKQELYGQMLDDAEGLVFTQAMIESAHLKDDEIVPHLPLRFIAVDPSVSGDPSAADECGIMAIGCTIERDLTRRRAYVLGDYSLRAAPDVWAKQVVDAAQIHRTKFVVVEKNQGGQLLQMAINAVDPTLKVFLVVATKGKVVRAEPVVIAMQQKRIKFIDYMPTLEEQLLFFDPDNSTYSPDRMDAFVWGIVAALVTPPPGLRAGSYKASSASGRKLPQGLGTGRTQSRTPSMRRR
jgi:phage terminase large subunit-like protein